MTKSTTHRLTPQTAAGAVVFTRIMAKGGMARETGGVGSVGGLHKSGSTYSCSEFWPNFLPIIRAQFAAAHFAVDALLNRCAMFNRDTPGLPIANCGHGDTKCVGEF